MNLISAVQFNFYDQIKRLLLVAFTVLLLNNFVFAGNLSLAWNASTSSDVGGYRIHYGQTSKSYSSSIDVGNQTSYQITGLTAGTTYYFAVKAYDATNANESSYSNEVSATVSNASTLSANFTANTTTGYSPLVISFTPNTTGTVTGWTWNFGDPNIPDSTSQNPTVTYVTPGTYNVRLTVTGSGGSATLTKPSFITVTASPPVANFSATPRTGNAPVSVKFTDTSSGNIASRVWDFGDGTTSAAQNPTHIYSAAGVYSVSLNVTGAGGSNTKTSAGFINVASSTVTATSGLVAAYSFDELGTIMSVDASGKANHGTIKEALRISAGRYGKAMLFDGVNDWITVNDSAFLDLSSGFTLEAWVKPVAIKVGNLITKEQLGGAVYNLYAHEDADLPISSFNDGLSYQIIAGSNQLPINQWSHLVSTYDGSYQRLFFNGVQVSVRAQNGLIKQSNSALRIGGNSIWGEYFHGYIDEVRIYNRALTKAELVKDLNTSVSVSNPPIKMLGNSILEPFVDYAPEGKAEAFKINATKNGVITSLQVYLDISSTATTLVSGIYSDNNGHPGTLLSQGKLNLPRAGATNTIAVPAVNIVKGKSYWIAYLGSKGIIKYRIRSGSGAGLTPIEVSAASALANLPNPWVVGQVYPANGPVSIYGTGY